jgi:hypothetical protein
MAFATVHAARISLLTSSVSSAGVRWIETEKSEHVVHLQSGGIEQQFRGLPFSHDPADVNVLGRARPATKAQLQREALEQPAVRGDNLPACEQRAGRFSGITEFDYDSLA